MLTDEGEIYYSYAEEGALHYFGNGFDAISGFTSGGIEAEGIFVAKATVKVLGMKEASYTFFRSETDKFTFYFE